MTSWQKNTVLNLLSHPADSWQYMFFANQKHVDTFFLYHADFDSAVLMAWLGQGTQKHNLARVSKNHSKKYLYSSLPNSPQFILVTGLF